MDLPEKGKCKICGKMVHLIFGPKPILTYLDKLYKKRDYAVMGCEIPSESELKDRIMCMRCMEKNQVG